MPGKTNYRQRTLEERVGQFTAIVTELSVPLWVRLLIYTKAMVILDNASQ